MFKRILKIVGICLALFVVVAGAGVGIYALSGGFKTIIIDITKLYADDQSKADKEIYTLGDVTTVVNCDPMDATDKTLEVIVSDPLRVVDENGKLVKEGILKNVPKTVIAGEPFTLEVNKDDMGNNIGGVVSLTFRPANKDKIITDFTLKVIVDVAIPNNSLYFAGNDSDELTTAGKKITMGLSSKPQNIYLKSNLVNAFCLETSNGNLKQAEISYVYKNQKGDVVDQKTFKDLKYQPNYNPSTKEYNYYYEVPVTPNVAGTIAVTAKMHRTNEIEKAYNNGLGENKSFDQMRVPTQNSIESQNEIDAYNKFINTYISFFDKSEESYKFFKDYLNDEGKVNLPYAQVENSKKYVFQTCTTTITVTAVNLSGITSTDSQLEYSVLTSRTFTLDQLIDEFELKVTLDQIESEVANLNTERANLFSTLRVEPYVYVEKEDYIANKDILWNEYKMIWGVDAFENGQPIIADGNIETKGEFENLTDDQIAGFNGKGFLLSLNRDGSKFDEYIEVNLNEDLSNKIWTFNYNVPLMVSNTQSLNDVKRIAFLEFIVEGKNLNTGAKIIKSSFSRVSVNYETYTFYDLENAKIGFVDEVKRMSINNDMKNASHYSEKPREQNVDIKLQSVLSNYNSVQYKSVMYFVEESSNQIEDGGQKVATIGKYDFKYMNPTVVSGGEGQASADGKIKLFNSTDKNLIGERLLNRGTRENPEYYIRTLNASAEPINIFAVVYLSDAKGNPIDINGERINIDETSPGDPQTIVVFAITDISEAGIQKVYVDSFVENFNFYTKNNAMSDILVEKTEVIDDTEQTATYTIPAGSFIKRNRLTEDYIDETTGIVIDKDVINNQLDLKFLCKNSFELFATNFEWDSTGSPSTGVGYDEESTEYIDVRDFNGTLIENQPYIINTYSNKQLALNNAIVDFADKYKLSIKSTNSKPIESVELVYEGGKLESELTPEEEAIKDSFIPIGVRYVLKVEDKLIGSSGESGNDQDYISMSLNSENTQALSYISINDNVGWKVSKLKVENVTLSNQSDEFENYFETNIKLHGRYTENYVSGGNNQEFGRVKLGSSGLEYSKYYLYNNVDAETSSSIRNNIDFMLDDNIGAGENLDLNVVDMSQAVYVASEEGASDISSYKSSYLNSTTNVNIQYITPTSLYVLEEDLVFTTAGDNYIYVGDDKYPIIDGLFVIINNKKHTLNGRQLKIAKDSYLPAIVDGGKEYVIVLGEKFEVTNSALGTTISNIVETNTHLDEYKDEFVITKLLDYIPNEYIDSNAIIKNWNDGIASAQVNFKKGGIALKDGQPIFVADPNGKYKRVAGKYTICNPTDNIPAEERYSKKGIVTFLLIKIDGEVFDESVIKSIEYELIQDPIELKAIDDEANQVNFLTQTASETEKESLNVTAGKDTTFKLMNGSSASTNSYSINLLQSSIDSYFFNHCKFIISNNTKGIKFVVDGGYANEISYVHGITEITLHVPSLTANDSVDLSIKYDYQGSTVEKAITLNIIADMKFVIKEGAEGISSNDYYHEISKNANSIYDIESIIAEYFETEVDVELEPVGANNEILSSISSGVLTIGKSYALFDNNEPLDATNPTINKDVLEFNIKLTKASKELVLDKKLKININPTYTFDLRGLFSGIRLINGDSLLDTNDYIKVYNGYKASLITDKHTIAILYKSLFTIIDKETGSECVDGCIVDTSNYMTETTKQLQLQYVYGVANTVKSFDFSVTIIGYEMYYTADKSIAELKSIVDVAEAYQKAKTDFAGSKLTSGATLNINVPTGSKIDVDDYFRVFTSDNIAHYVQLKDSAGNYYRIIDKNKSGEYTVVIAYNDVAIMETEYKVTITFA